MIKEVENLNEIEGIGKKTIEQLNKLDIYNLEDLITYYPSKYLILKRTDMNLIENESKVIIDGISENIPTITTINHNLKKITFRLSTPNNIYNIIVFNQIHLCYELKNGTPLTIIGKYNKYQNSITATEVRKGLLSKYSTIEPIYTTKNIINKKNFQKIINNALNKKIILKDNISPELIEKYQFPNKNSSIKEIHQPTSTINYNKALQRLKYEELYLYLKKIKELNQKNLQKGLPKNIDTKKIKNYLESLPFQLTKDQLTTINEIKKDLASSYTMNRLVQGDVGSGKTIVAFIASYMNYLAGFQTAMMVPTEILANQHYKNATTLFANTNLKIDVITSKTKNKNNIYKKLESGEIDFIIGTQSLIQEKINYHNLGLIITDEQHRFGVNQRKKLKDKGYYPDILSMSATPIPRTYALTIYGDIAVSNIKTKPKGRQEIITIFKQEKQITEVLKLMKKELDNNHQIYVIAPLIESEDSTQLNNVNILQEKMTLAFGKIATIATIHGSLDEEHKNKIMQDYEKGHINILISTTVIEVGINVPNATMIVIFNANLFGLSTLHQLRGRVGRGTQQSYCLLIAKEINDRLKMLETCNDGFKISEYDFKTRGQGDIFGIRQSGDIKFKLADLKKDYELLKRVKNDLN